MRPSTISKMKIIYSPKEIILITTFVSKHIFNAKCQHCQLCLNPLSVDSTKLSNTLKQFVGNLSTNFLSVFDHFGGLALQGLKAL